MTFDWAKELLLEQKQQIESRLEDSESYGLENAMSDELSELSLYDNHPADVASELYEREKDLGIKIGDKERLKAISQALSAIEQGTYGTCQRCGKSISAERLQANPTALLCIRCKRGEELAHPNRLRPIEEELLYPSYGRTNLDRTNQIGFDGEDAWQGVARFNQRNPDDVIYEEIELDDNHGLVDSADFVTNETYQNQLPGE